MLEDELSAAKRETEIEKAVLWLVGKAAVAADTAVTTDTCSCLLPKAANYLLPFEAAAKYRRMVRAKIPLSPLQGIARWILLRRFSFKNRHRQWPETMELDMMAEGASGPVSVVAEDRPVCLVMSLPSYASVIKRLASALQDAGMSVCIFLPRNQDKTCLTGLAPRIRIEYIEDFTTHEVRSLYTESVDRLSAAYVNSVQEQIKDAPDLVRDIYGLCPEQLQYVFEQVIPQVAAFQMLAEEIYDRFNPSALLLVRLKRITESAFAAIAKQKSIPVFLVNHGHVGSDWNYWNLGGVDRYCDVVYLWNEAQRETWSTLFPEMQRGRLKAVGGLQWDEPIARYQSDKGESRQFVAELLNFKADDPGPWFVITMDDLIRPKLSAVLAELVKCAGARVFIKIRPSEKSADYEYINEYLGDQVHLVTNDIEIDLFRLLHAADLVFACISTTNIDALAVGVPVLTLALVAQARADERSQLLKPFGLPWLQTEKELGEALAAWRRDGQTGRQWRDAASTAVGAMLANYPEGRARERIVKDLRKASQCSEN